MSCDLFDSIGWGRWGPVALGGASRELRRRCCGWSVSVWLLGYPRRVNFISTALTALIVIGGLIVARDWLAGLRADVAATRRELASLQTLCVGLAGAVATRERPEVVAARENGEAAAREIWKSTLIEVRELRREVAIVAGRCATMAARLQQLSEDAGTASAEPSDGGVPNWPEMQR